ncbi:hypothetical protein ACPA9J_15565 [Pseudomonas aeruginosa]
MLVALGHALGYLLAKVGGDRFAVDQLCGHVGRVTIESGGKRTRIFRMDAARGKEATRGFAVTPLYS